MANKRISFKIKVLIPIIIIFVISILFFAFINYRLLASAVRHKTNDNLELFADNILSQISHLNFILDSTKQTLNEKHTAIARTVAFVLDNGDGEITVQELQKLAQLLDIIELNIGDKDGNLIKSNRAELIGDDYKTTKMTLPYLSLADGTIKELNEEPRASILPDFSLGEINHYTGVALSGGGFVQLGFNADVIGMLKEKINIEQTIKETRIGENGFGFVLTNGKISAHPNDELIGKVVTGEGWYNAVNGGSGFAWIEIDNKKYYAGYKNEGENTVVALAPREDYFRELNRVLIETVRLLLFSIIAMSIVVFFVLGKLLLPIKHLVKGLAKIAETKMSAIIEGSYNNEFDEIKDAVNSMAVEVKNYMNVISGIKYAAKIQKNLLPPQSAFKEAFADYSCLWKPKDIVSGDIYWIKNFPEGTVLCVCDCTGHGTPGALLTMLVVSIFEAAVTSKNYKDTAQIIWELEKRLVAELNVTAGGSRGLKINDGCDLAVLFIAKDGSVTVSAANTVVFVCDGEKVTKIKGQKIHIGDGALKGADSINIINIDANTSNKFYIASDGLYEQIGGSDSGQKLPFGYDTIEKIILENHKMSQDAISKKIFAAFEEYRGENAQRDDFQLITFKPLSF